MAMEAAMHKRNLESSILFMQQEHGATLKALHEEIHRLQKRCTDLTFQLTMHGISVDEEGDLDSRLGEVQQQLAAAECREQQLEEQFRERESRLHTMEHEARAQKKRHLDEMRNAAQTISGLKAEVEAKSNNIAFLTTEIHRLKIQHKTSVSGGGETSIIRRAQPQLGHLPAPPRELLANSGRGRRGSIHTFTHPGLRKISGPNTSTNISSMVSGIGVASGLGAEGDLQARSLRIVSASTRSVSSGSQSPDITPFVQRPEIDIVEVKKSQPLPPINSSQSSATTSTVPSSASSIPVGLGERNVRIVDGVRQVLISSKRRSGHGRHHHRGLPLGRPTTPEVTTLAVDQVNSENKNWNRPSESHSSEYN